jgi:sporulation protein YlmC with PRC-barrel domain
MDNMKHRRLQELDRSDFEIVEGDSDIRGWDVKNTAGKKIGEVEELIVDAQQKKVRYMLVDLDDNELKLDHKKVLIPIGMAELHKDDDDVILPVVNETQLQALPDYDDDKLDADMERTICSALGREKTGAAQSADLPADFYHHSYFNDDNLYKHRLHEARSTKQESEYEKGLRLWERRSEGGVLPDKEAGRGSSRNLNRTEASRSERMELVRNRRQAYEQRRGGLGRDHFSSGRGSIEDRIRNEGLRDA